MGVMNSGTQFSKARIETLCDGVFAIAMTLLVLELRVPVLPRPVATADMWRALGGLRLGFFAYGLSFMLAGAFWMQHHVFFHYVARATRPLALVTLVFLMFVALVPFSTSLFAAYGSKGIAFYFGNQFVLALLLTLQWVVARQQGQWTVDVGDPQRRRFEALILTFPIVFGFLCAVAVLRPESAGMAAMPALLIIAIVRRLATKRARAAQTS
jgi:uncharacterized membrane protein